MKTSSRLLGLLPAMAALAALSCHETPVPSSPNIEIAAASIEPPPGGIRISACGAEISQPGDYWLTRDLINCRNVYATIIIIASDVTLHLNGHRIAASGGRNIAEVCVAGSGSNVRILGPGVLGFCWKGISTGATHSLIRGLTISGYDLGIELTNASDLTIEDVTIIGGGYAAVFGPSGLTNVVLRRNTFQGEGIEQGLMLGGTGIEVRENFFEDEGQALLLTGDNNVVAANKITRSGTAININGTGNQITGNIVRHNFGEGIVIAGTGNLITANRLTQNSPGIFDMVDLNGVCDLNTWTGNQFTNASPDCLH